MTVADRNALLEEHLPLLRSLARRIAATVPHAGDVDDLVQDAAVIAMRALERYEPREGVSLRSYLRAWVGAKLRNVVSDRDPATRWARSILARAAAYEERYVAEFGRTPTYAEIVAAIPNYERARVRSTWRSPLALDRPLSANENLFASECADFHETIRAVAPSVEDQVLYAELRAIIDRLPAREASALAARVDLDEDYPTMSRRTGVDSCTLRGRARRGVIRLRKQVREHGHQLQPE